MNSNYTFERINNIYLGNSAHEFHKRNGEKEEILKKDFIKKADGYIIIPEFKDVKILFNSHFPKNAESLFFLPEYTFGNFYESKNEGQTQVKGKIITKGSKPLTVEGDLIQILAGRQIESEDRNLPNVIVVDDGANMFRAFLKNYHNMPDIK